MSSKDPVLDFFEALNSRNTDQMGRLMASDAEFYFPKTQPLLGRDRIMRFFQILFRQYPQLTFEVRRVIRQHDQIAVHWTNRGRSRQKETYQNEGVTIVEIEGNTIRLMSDFFKDTERF